jgi:hypothetical protein
MHDYPQIGAISPITRQSGQENDTTTKYQNGRKYPLAPRATEFPHSLSAKLPSRSTAENDRPPPAVKIEGVRFGPMLVIRNASPKT